MRDPTGKLPGWFLMIAGYVFDHITFLRNKLYDWNLLKSFSVDVPVISIGNLSVGGTGKTPLVMKLAEFLSNKRVNTVIISRGYSGRKGRIPEQVPPDGDFRDYGDEPTLMARSLPNVPVVVSRNRVEGALWSIRQFSPQCILLDDGFQHRRLKRNLDIVVVDSRRSIANDFVFPRGRLRERQSGLERAHLIVFSHANEAEPRTRDLQFLEALPGQPVVFRSCHVPSILRPVWSHDTVTDDAFNKKTGLISAIGSPEGFRSTAEIVGLSIAYEKHFPDHWALTASHWDQEIRTARMNGCDMVVITAKDESKFPRSLETDIPVMVLDISIDINDGAIFESEIMKEITLGA